MRLLNRNFETALCKQERIKEQHKLLERNIRDSEDDGKWPYFKSLRQPSVTLKYTNTEYLTARTDQEE